MEYELKWHDNNIVVKFEGNVTYENIVNVDNYIFGDSRFDSMKFAIFDFSKVNNVIITKEELSIISVLDSGASRWNKKLNLIFITNENNNFVHETVITYTNLMKENSWEIKHFLKLEDALEWCTK